MTVLTMRREHGEFVVTGPDIEPVKFRTRREARDWCARHYSGSPIKEVRANSSNQSTRARPPNRRAAGTNGAG
jgi:hypothetical protein